MRELREVVVVLLMHTAKDCPGNSPHQVPERVSGRLHQKTHDGVLNNSSHVEPHRATRHLLLDLSYVLLYLTYGHYYGYRGRFGHLPPSTSRRELCSNSE